MSRPQIVLAVVVLVWAAVLMQAAWRSRSVLRELDARAHRDYPDSERDRRNYASGVREGVRFTRRQLTHQ